MKYIKWIFLLILSVPKKTIFGVGAIVGIFFKYMIYKNKQVNKATLERDISNEYIKRRDKAIKDIESMSYDETIKNFNKKAKRGKRK